MKTKKGLCFTCVLTMLFAPLFGLNRTYAAQEESFFNYYNQKSEYEISTESELLELANIIIRQDFGWNVTDIYTFEGVTIKLMNDIEMTEEWVVPIGSSKTHPFAGIFDGNGHTISNIHLSDSSDSNLGVFGYVTGEIRNLNVTGFIETNGNQVGGIAGTLAENAVISNCSSSMNLTGTSKVGGIAGENLAGTISGCSNSGSIRGKIRIGGIVGENRDGRVKQCLNEGTIRSTNYGFGTYGTGGIAGRSVSQNALITESCNLGKILSSNECTGGIVGYCSARGSTVSACSNLGEVSGNKQHGAVGGIIGSISQNGVILKNSYNAGQIKNGTSIGGVIGKFSAERHEELSEFVHNNYYVDSTASKAVGLAKDVPGQYNYQNVATPKSIHQMKSSRMASQIDSAFQSDAKGINCINDGFPVFSWQKSRSDAKGDILQGLEIKYKQNFIDFFKQNPYGQIQYGMCLIEAVQPQMAYDEMIDVMKKGEF